MTTSINNKIETLLSQSSNEVLIFKLSELFGNVKMSYLTCAIIEELENRIGEEETDFIVDGLKAAA